MTIVYETPSHEGETLTQALKRLGFSCCDSPFPGKKTVVDKLGVTLGHFDAYECWVFLREAGLIEKGAKE